MNFKSIKFWVLVLLLLGVVLFFMPLPVRHAPPGKVLVKGTSGEPSHFETLEVDFHRGMTVREALEVWRKSTAYRETPRRGPYYLLIELREQSGWDRARPWVVSRWEGLLSKLFPSRQGTNYFDFPAVPFDTVIFDGDAVNIGVYPFRPVSRLPMPVVGE